MNRFFRSFQITDDIFGERDEKSIKLRKQLRFYYSLERIDSSLPYKILLLRDTNTVPIDTFDNRSKDRCNYFPSTDFEHEFEHPFHT